MNSISGNNTVSFKRATPNMAKIITGMTKNDALMPIVALEATVVGGRTYQAYKRGKWDEARERFIEEIMGSIVWLCGVAAFNKLGDQAVAKILESNGKNFDVGTDKVLRTPFENFMKKVAPKKFTATQVAGIKSVKVLTSILLANGIIGFVVPKVNQALTRRLRHERKEEQKLHSSQNPTFKGGAMNAVNTFTNVIENTNTGKLLSSDAGIAGGRMYNARSKEERREIAIRDIGSIYFYMWARGHVGSLMNLAESGHASRLNPNTVKILDHHLSKFLDGYTGMMKVEDFRDAVLGKNRADITLPENMKFVSEEQSVFDKMFNRKPLEVIKLSDAKTYFKDKGVLERLEKMSTLQPLKEGEAMLTKQQVIDAINKAEINNTELLHNVFSEFTEGEGKEIGKDAKGRKIRSEVEFVGGKYNDEYRFVSNKKLYKLKSEMEQYVEQICDSARNSNNGIVDKKLLEAAKRKNIMYSGLNFITGFIISALFLSTFIPKIQYYVTKRATGVDAFPGVYDFEKNKEVDD